MTTDPAPPHPVEIPVITLRISARGLFDSWSHCRGIADYVARSVASDRLDPDQLSTRLSACLSEILEHLFRARIDSSDVVVTLGRSADRLIIELYIPADDELRVRLTRGVSGAPRSESRAQGSEATPAGLLELVALDGVSFALRDEPAACVLVLSVPGA